MGSGSRAAREAVTIVGGGLAGCEAAWQAARRGVDVTLYEMKPARTSPAHRSPDLAEQVRRWLIELQFPCHCRCMRKQIWAGIRLEKARFQNILTARGLPPNLFGKFPSRVISFPSRKRYIDAFDPKSRP